MKRWKVKGRAEAKSDIKQLHFRDTFRPKHYRYIYEYEKNIILKSHMLLKGKRDGTIKGRTLSGGNKQRGLITKYDSSSPTVSPEAVILYCIIYAE